MLRELQIANFTLVDHVRLQFGPGLNILTGETGAGKSILIDALGLALGERSSGADQIRAGVERAAVDALFDLSDAPESVARKLADYGVADEDDPHVLTVAREITTGGKSVCRVNGRLLPLAGLRDIAADLIDVHGQHEHQSLLSPEKHLLLYDNWLGDRAFTLRAQAAAESSELNRLKREYESLRSEAREQARNLDLYEYQAQEITEASLSSAEEDELTADRSRLANAEKLLSSAEDAYAALNDVGLDSLNSALGTIERAQILDSELEPVRLALTEAVSFADDARRELRRYREHLAFNPTRLEEIEDRLALINALKRKYGDTIAEVIAYAADIREKIIRLREHEVIESQIVAQLADRELGLSKVCTELSSLRRSQAKAFEQQVAGQLADLGMAAARFEMRIETVPPGARGIDDIEFMITANAGEPLRPLAKVASGGELSRLMLAMKSVLAQAAFVPTLIFDEIDVGVGGRTAAVIADKLRSLAKTAQVLVITHLPQIASRPATAHFAIEKQAVSGRTVVCVRRLTDETRVDEIVRMLGGDHASETAVRHAREMLAVQ